MSDPIELWRLRNPSREVVICRGTALLDGYRLDVTRGNETLIAEVHSAWRDVIARAEAIRHTFVEEGWTGAFDPRS